MSGSYPPGSLGARVEELAEKLVALQAELKREHPWAWRYVMIRTFPRRLKEKTSAALPCRLFGHKWEDSWSRISKRCVRCGRVEMGAPLKGILQELLGRRI